MSVSPKLEILTLRSSDGVETKVGRLYDPFLIFGVMLTIGGIDPVKDVAIKAIFIRNLLQNCEDINGAPSLESVLCYTIFKVAPFHQIASLT